MSAPESPDGVRLARLRIALLLFAALTSVPLLGVRDLWQSDEPRYALVGREIVRDGDWIVMHLNREIYTEKPPLYFWCEALLGSLTGDVGPFTARLPSSLSGAIGVLLCFELGRRLLGARIAFAGALMLATAVQWWWLSQRCALDVMLAAFVLAAMLLVEMGRAASGARADRWFVAAFVAAGGGFLVKGPPVLVFFAGALLARAWAAREWRFLARLPWLRGLLALAAVVALWAAPWAARLGLDEVERILVRQTAGRISRSIAHAEPWHFFLRTVPGTFAPWSLAWIGLAWVAWKRRRRAPPGRAGLPDGARYLLAWSAWCLVAFSCFSGKRTLYLLPILPALALCTAFALDRLAPAGRDLLLPVRRVAVGAGLLMLVLALVWMPLADRGFELGPLRVPSQSSRRIGERVRREADAGATVALIDLHYAESVIYFSGLDRVATIDLPWLDPTDGGHPDVRRIRELADRLRDRLVLVLETTEAERLLQALPRGADPIDETSCDGRTYALLRAR